MNIHCPECDAAIPLDEEVVEAGVPKIRCSRCDAKFQVAPGGSTYQLTAGSKQEVTYEPSASSGSSAGTGQDAPSDHSSDASSDVGEPGAFDAPNLTRVAPGGASYAQPDGGFMDYPRLEAGQVFFGKFRIEREIGKGATAIVYRVLDTVAELAVALKVVGVIGDGADRFRKSWADEFKARRQVADGTYLLHLESPVTEHRDGVSYVALPQELAERSLREWMTETAHDLEGRREQALTYFRQACRGVLALHQADLAHLDLKPENLLLVSDASDGSATGNRIKIGDFGLARNLASLDDSDAGSRRFGLGTSTYMAPEQIRSARFKDIGKAADLYSLGVILHELIDGAPPFEGETGDEVREKHLKMEPERPDDVPEEYWEIIVRCLEKKPTQRLRDLNELQRLLDKAPERGEVIRREKAENERKSRERRHEENWAKANSLRDAEPNRALEHLQAILDDPPVDAEARVNELRDELEALRKKVDKVLRRARQQELEKPAGTALDAWSDVLKLVPRNAVAGERVDALKKRQQQCEESFGKARTEADRANYDTALEAVARCLEIDPNRSDVREAGAEIRERQKVYQEGMDRAQQKLEESRPDLAVNALDKAEVAAPRSQSISKLKQTASDRLTELETKLEKARDALTAAKFDDVRKALVDLRGLISGSRKVTDLEKKLKETEPKYQAAVDKAERALEDSDLGTAAKAVQSALKHCPDSSAAMKLQSKADKSGEKYRDFIESARQAIDAANFSNARAALGNARNENAHDWELGQAQEALEETEQEYPKHMKAARSSEQKGDLDGAQESVVNALRICPSALEATSLQQEVQNRKQRSVALLQEAQNLLGTEGHLEIPDLHTRFFEISEKLSQARESWPMNSELEPVEREANERTTAFHERFNQIKSLLENKKTDDARLAINELEVFERGTEIDEFRSQIQNIEEGRRERNAAIKRNVLLWLPRVGIGIAALIGIALLVWALSFVIGVGRDVLGSFFESVEEFGAGRSFFDGITFFLWSVAIQVYPPGSNALQATISVPLQLIQLTLATGVVVCMINACGLAEFFDEMGEPAGTLLVAVVLYLLSLIVAHFVFGGMNYPGLSFGRNFVGGIQNIGTAIFAITILLQVILTIVSVIQKKAKYMLLGLVCAVLSWALPFGFLMLLSALPGPAILNN